MTWLWTANDTYSASSAYALHFSGCIKPPFAKMAWNSDAPPKCQLFAWLALQGRCLTADNLARRGWDHDPRCLMCLNAAEPSLHLFAICPFASELWHLVLDKLQRPASLIPAATDGTLTAWCDRSSLDLTQDAAKFWRSIVVCWSIWKERNECVFRHHSSVTTLFRKHQMEAQMWTEAGRMCVLLLADRPRLNVRLPVSPFCFILLLWEHFTPA